MRNQWIGLLCRKRSVFVRIPAETLREGEAPAEPIPRCSPGGSRSRVFSRAARLPPGERGEDALTNSEQLRFEDGPALLTPGRIESGTMLTHLSKPTKAYRC